MPFVWSRFVAELDITDDNYAIFDLNLAATEALRAINSQNVNFNVVKCVNFCSLFAHTDDRHLRALSSTT